MSLTTFARQLRRQSRRRARPRAAWRCRSRAADLPWAGHQHIERLDIAVNDAVERGAVPWRATRRRRSEAPCRRRGRGRRPGRCADLPVILEHQVAVPGAGETGIHEMRDMRVLQAAEDVSSRMNRSCPAHPERNVRSARRSGPRSGRRCGRPAGRCSSRPHQSERAMYRRQPCRHRDRADNCGPLENPSLTKFDHRRRFCEPIGNDSCISSTPTQAARCPVSMPSASSR